MAPSCLMTEQDGAAACVPARARRVFSRMGIAGRTSAGAFNRPSSALRRRPRAIDPRNRTTRPSAGQRFLLSQVKGRSA